MTPPPVDSDLTLWLLAAATGAVILGLIGAALKDSQANRTGWAEAANNLVLRITENRQRTDAQAQEIVLMQAQLARMTKELARIRQTIEVTEVYLLTDVLPRLGSPPMPPPERSVVTVGANASESDHG